MQKIMFNDKYGLTEAVLKGRKTMTRRAIPASIGEVRYRPTVSNCYFFADSNDREVDPRYHIGEVVAIAQSYKTLEVESLKDGFVGDNIDWQVHFRNHKGWNNKMFVRADLMPHHIRITNIKVERLQDISEEDCINEGIITDFRLQSMSTKYYIPNQPTVDFIEPREAFAALIDKVNGKGTWESNPYVIVYSFELVD